MIIYLDLYMNSIMNVMKLVQMVIILTKMVQKFVNVGLIIHVKIVRQKHQKKICVQVVMNMMDFIQKKKKVQKI